MKSVSSYISIEKQAFSLINSTVTVYNKKPVSYRSFTGIKLNVHLNSSQPMTFHL